MNSISIEHIEIEPDRCGGKPHVKGTRIRVHDVTHLHFDEGLSAQQIVDEYPPLTLADVYAALTYFHDHREQIEAIVEQEQVFIEEMKARYPSKLMEHVRERFHAENDSLPSR